jgi:RNA polymerase sigma-70 factor, ECF subfamily
MSREQENFIELLKPVYGELLRYCRAMCKNGKGDEAEDVLQNTLLKGITKFSSLSDESKFKSWIFMIATREYISNVRNHFWKRFVPSDTARDEKWLYDIYDRDEKDHDKSLLFSAMSELNPKERSAILLFEIAGFSIEEITAMQGERSVSAVKSRLSRCREKLRRRISELEKTGRWATAGREVSLETETVRIVSELKQKGETPDGQVLG